VNARSLGCADVDELAAAYALGAVEPDEERAVSEHLGTCDRAHTEAREVIGSAAWVPASLEPISPSAALRSRLMATVAATPQAHRPAPEGARVPIAMPASRPWWRLQPLPAALGAAALAAAVGLGAWGVSTSNQLAERDAALRAIASADAIHPASGNAGSGWLIESGEAAMFMADGLAQPPVGHLYELWLIHADGSVQAVGTVDDADGWTIVELERGVGEAVTFAITAETERVEAPTTEPILTAELDT
jgi:anti-sigma-K factor RskA